jgi:hypothetical protein
MLVCCFKSSLWNVEDYDWNGDKKENQDYVNKSLSIPAIYIIYPVNHFVIPLCFFILWRLLIFQRAHEAITLSILDSKGIWTT